jgi:fermentation-respiration switch protein FrsA (DUF1100 family)
MQRGHESRRLMLPILIGSLLLAGCSGSAGSPTPSATGSVAAPSPTVTPGAGAASPGSTGLDEPAASTARSYVDALARGDTTAAAALEDDTMRSAAPAAQLATLWNQIVAQFGVCQGMGEIQTTPNPPYVVAVIDTSFANAVVPLQVTVDASGRVAGLHLGTPTTQASPSVTGSPAAYVDPASFTETEVTAGSPPWSLPATLSMPVGEGPHPGVVLVAGSGPADRDETVGPNKPLRDLAWGLASSAIAVLRYDKRTLVHGAQLAGSTDLTVRQETTDDAEAAVRLLRSTPGVDPDRVFVVGHSLGGYLAPRIAAEIPGELHGIGLLEAPSSTLPQLILMQAEYLTPIQVGPGPAASAALSELAAKVALAESPTLSTSTPASELPFGIPAAYWLDLRTYDPVATARALSMPMLFTQGGRDYQVPPSELAPWQTALAGRPNVTFQTYPALDHLLFAGSGPSTPDEYSRPAHVDGTLVRDLAAWLTGG